MYSFINKNNIFLNVMFCSANFSQAAIDLETLYNTAVCFRV